MRRMDEWIKITEYNWAFWIAGLFAIAEFLRWLFTSCEFFMRIIQKIFKFFGIKIKTRRMTEREKNNERLNNIENSITVIKDTSKSNVDMFIEHEEKVVANFADIKDEVVKQLADMSIRMDEQQRQIESRLEEIDKDGKRRDIALMRDRILAGFRYFNQNKDRDGIVHISLTDFENMNGMITEYLKAGGNGAVKHIYENEFTKYKIDSETFDKKV